MSESQAGPSFDPSLPEPVLQAAGDSPFALSQEPVTPEGPQTPPPADALPAPAYEHLGELPATYGTQSVYLVAYDPHRLFAYWDVDWKEAPDTRYVLRVCRGDGQMEARIDISAADAGRYLEIKQPGGTYYVELGSHARDGSWQPAAASARVTMPPEGISHETEGQFATLPFHLSFQRLLELIQTTMGSDEDLTAALARLQEGDPSQVAAVFGSAGHLTGEQLHTLELLLGHPVGTSPTGDSAANPFRDQPGVASSAAFGSEALSSGGFGSENLSSGAFRGGQGLPARTSGVGLSSGAFGSESLSSEAFGSDLLGLGGLSSDFLSSGAFGSEAWRTAGVVTGETGKGPTGAQSAVFFRALEGNLDVLGSLFSGFGSPGASDGFSSGGW